MVRRLPEIFAKCVATRLRRVVTVLSLLIILFFLLILSTPAILSSNFVQNRIKTTLSTTLQGPVNWSRLDLSWSQGLQLRDFTVGPATGGVRQARIAALDCRPGFGFGAHRDESFGLDLYFHLHDLTLELTPSPTTTPAVPPSAAPTGEGPDPLTALAQGLDRFTTLNFPLPVDLRIDLAIDPIILSYHDPVSGRSLLFEQGSMQLLIPSLERAPLNFSLDGKIQVDTHQLGALHLASQISGLVSPTGRIVPAGALLSTVLDFPGIALKADGRLDQAQGVNGELRLDLPALQGVAAPFLPANLPSLDGTFLATLHARVDKEQNLALRCTLNGQELRGRGGLLPAAGIGPLNFDLGQQIRTDHRRQIITLEDGFIKMPPLLAANWEGTVTEPTSLDRRVDARLAELQIDLDQLLALAAPLLPPGLPQLLGGRLDLRDLDLQLRGVKGDGEVRLAAVKLLVPSLRLVQPPIEMTGAGITLAANDLKVPLIAYFPSSVATAIEWRIAGLQLHGAQELALRGVAGAGMVEINAISKGGVKGGVSCNGRFSHQLRLQSVEVATLARISDLVNDLRLDFVLQGDGGVKVKTLQLNTAIAAVTATVAGKELLPLAIDEKLQVDGVELVAGAPLPLIKGVAFSLSSPQLFTLSGTASLARERLLTLATRTGLELPRLIALAKPLLPPGLTATGTISNDVQLVATLPDRPLPGGEAPLRSAQRALELLEDLSASVHLDAVELYLPLSNGTLHLSGIKTPQPLRLHSSPKGHQLDFGGAVDFDLRAGSVLNNKALPAEHGQLSCNGEVRDWERIFLRETVKIEPLGVAQRSELTMTGLTSLLDLPLPPTPATLLQRLDATFFGEVDVNLRPGSPPLLPGLSASGKTCSGTRIDLRAGRSLRLHAYADIKDLDVEMSKGPKLHGLQGHFNLDRSLRISNSATPQGRWLPLSTSLVQPQPPPLSPPVAGERWRLHNDLRGQSAGERSLRIASLFLPVAPLPLTIQALEAEIVTGKEELGMDFLQLELLGGTLRASALIDLRPPVPVVTAEALFTNLDLARLAGSGVTPLRPGEAESSISGEGSLTLPLLTDERALLEGLTLTGRLRHVGAKSFDRALASLDPYERNEAIMSQRKLLRLGQLQGVEVQVADGALSLSGAVSSAGVTLALPRIDRLRLAELPLHKELTPALQGITLARLALEFARADTIQLGPQGEISLRQEEK